MATITRPPAAPAPQKDYEYNSQFYKWLGFVQKIPLLASIIDATVDATVASWRVTGEHASEMADILDDMVGNGKENYTQIMKNMLSISIVGGDAYAEIVFDEEDVTDLRILNPDSITQIIKDGRIENYRVKQTNQMLQPENVFHLASNRIGSAPHGFSTIEPMNNLLIHFMQVQDDMARLFHRYIKPLNIFRFKTNSSQEINTWMSEFRKQQAVMDSDIGIPDDLVSTIDRVSIPQGSTLDPTQWHNILINQFFMANRVSENILGIGTQNSEESAKMQMAGFAQLVRAKQKFLSWNNRQQLFMLQFPMHTPKIKFSFAIEPEEEKYNRLRETLTVVESLSIDPNLKSLLEEKLLIEMGVIEDD